jgi:cytochrome c peroxidase
MAIMASSLARDPRKLLRRSLALAVLSGIPGAAVFPQASPSDPANFAWQAGAIGHMQAMRKYVDAHSGEQPTPQAIPPFAQTPDFAGRLATLQAGGATVTSDNAFFANMGTNGRTCFSCHQPQDGWSVSAASVQARFDASGGTDPIFRLADGATCPSKDVSSAAAKREAYSLLLNKGLIRIGLPVPANAEFRVASVNDPYNCNTDPATGLTSPTTGIVSVYRRPLPASNLGFLSTIMWDGREPSLLSQAADATLGHAQASTAPTAFQKQQVVDFESGLFTAQSQDNIAGLLNSDGANGGPDALQKQLAGFFIGINDPFSPNATFTSQIFTLYDAWKSADGNGTVSAYRQSVARGENLFNTTRVNITNVGGLNDAPNQASILGFCGTCHDTPNVGNHSVAAPLNIGIADASPPALNVADLPVFTLQCVAGPMTGQTFTVTDPGRALISGRCADIGKFKGPILRGLAGRAPYFHNGSAGSLLDVINFYNARFNLDLTEQDKRDFVAFLQTL